MSKETTDLLGNQKKNNYALRADMTKEEFSAEVTDGFNTSSTIFCPKRSQKGQRTPSRFRQKLRKREGRLRRGTIEANG